MSKAGKLKTAKRFSAGDTKKKEGKPATWVVAISGLVAAAAALISAIATLIMAMK